MPHVDNLVLAAGESMSHGELEQLAGVRGAELIRVPELVPNNRGIGHLLARSQAGWQLLLDGDEIPSTSLLENLRGRCREPGITHVRSRCAWLWPDGRSELIGRPWNNDWHTRLRRTEPGFSWNVGAQHSPIETIGPGRYDEDASFYHAVLILRSTVEREQKVRAYNARADTPTFAFGIGFNEGFYLPEVRPDPAPVRFLPVQEARYVTRLLAGRTAAPKRLRRLPPVVPTEEIDAHWPLRALAPDALDCRIEIIDPDPSFVAGERRWLMVRVTNLGSEMWPGGDREFPAVRLAYRWSLESGEVDPGDAARSSLPGPVAPGSSSVLPLWLVAPAELGWHSLELGVVCGSADWDAVAQLPI